MTGSECYLRLGDGSVAYVRHNTSEPDKPTVLFVHSLGESGLYFSEAFKHLPESSFNVPPIPAQPSAPALAPWCPPREMDVIGLRC